MDSDSSLPRDKDFGRFQFGCQTLQETVQNHSSLLQSHLPRHCHNEAENSLSDPQERHDLVRKNVKQVICSICQTEQEVAQVCSNCGVYMGNTFVISANSLTTIPQKNNFIVITVEFVELVGVTNSFIARAVELVMQRACAIDTRALTRILVLFVMRFRCPICSKSMLEMTSSWQSLDREVAILCNDCNKRSTTMFHILGHKCGHCGSYNTRRISTPQDPVPETE